MPHLLWATWGRGTRPGIAQPSNRYTNLNQSLGHPGACWIPHLNSVHTYARALSFFMVQLLLVQPCSHMCCSAKESCLLCYGCIYFTTLFKLPFSSSFCFLSRLWWGLTSPPGLVWLIPVYLLSALFLCPDSTFRLGSLVRLNAPNLLKKSTSWNQSFATHCHMSTAPSPTSYCLRALWYLQPSAWHLSLWERGAASSLPKKAL